MKVLFFTYDFPYPTTSGGKNRAYNLLKYSGKDIEYILFSFYRDIPERESIEEVEKLNISTIRLFKRDFAGISSILTAEKKNIQDIASLIKIANPLEPITKKLYYKKSIAHEVLQTVEKEKIDIVHFESLYTAYYLHPRLKSLGVKQFFGTENIEYKQYQDFAQNKTSAVFSPLYRFEAKKIEHDEKRLLMMADQVIAVSESDAQEIKKISDKKATIIKNGVDLEYFTYKKSTVKKEKSLLFVGNFSYFPNIDAITHFYEDIWEKIKTENVSLTIIGKNSSRLPFVHDTHITTHEFVEDIRTAYHDASIFIFPMRIGGGTNFKLIEAMASGLPVVAYVDKAQQIGGKDGEDFLIAPDPATFAQHIDFLFQNAIQSERIAKSARKFIEENYSWEKIGKAMNTVWKENL